MISIFLLCITNSAIEFLSFDFKCSTIDMSALDYLATIQNCEVN